MNNIQTFQNNQFGQIRVAMNELGDPLFCLADVCRALAIANPRDAKNRLSPKGVVNADTLTDGGTQSMTYIDEGNLYKLALRSRKPDAEVFQDWLCYDVAVSIRKHGGYLSPQKIEEALLNPDTIIQLATSLKVEREKRIAAEKREAALIPKAEFIDKVFDADEKIDIGQVAKILELPFGRNTLFRKLREKGIFFKNKNEPKQEYCNRGYFQLKEKWIDRNNHDGFIVIKVLVTQSGLEFIDKLFVNEGRVKRLAKIA